MNITYGVFDPIAFFRRLRLEYPDSSLVVIIDRTILLDRNLGPLLAACVSCRDALRVVQLKADELGMLSSAESVNSALKGLGSSVCVVIGGGSSIDAAKVGVAAVKNPWILDAVVWQNSGGALPIVDQSDASHTLISIPTCPGSGSHVSNLAALAPGLSSARRVAFGDAIKSDFVYIDSSLWRDVDLKFKIDSLWEILFRILGPYVVANNVSFRQSEFTINLARQAVDLGWSILRSETSDAASKRFEIDRLSVDSTISWRTSGWTSTINPWWCIQNSLAPQLRISKREVVPLGLIQSLQLEPGNWRPRRAKTIDRLNFRAHLRRYSARHFPYLLSQIEDLYREYCRLFVTNSLGVDRELAERTAREAFSLWPFVFRQSSLQNMSEVVDFIESV